MTRADDARSAAVSWLFISDLHLSPDRPDITDQLESFLEAWRGRAQHLYILGDLFEVWLGDDMAGEFGAHIAATLQRFQAGGSTIALIHGNRDFLIGERFARACGATLLEDPQVLTIHGRRVLISHGDQLCTDDLAYQRMRRLFRRRSVQRGFLALPRRLRERMGAWLRARSHIDTRDKPAEITDVNDEAVAATLRAHGVDCLLHGHTHRPTVHTLNIDGQAAERIVLGDWYSQGSVLEWDASGYRLQRLVRSQASPSGTGTADPVS